MYACRKPTPLSSGPPSVVAHSFSHHTTTSLVFSCPPVSNVPKVPCRGAKGCTMAHIHLLRLHLEERLALFQNDPLVFPKLILPCARNRTLVDISLQLRSANLRSFALRWRKNRLVANYYCQCGSKLTRGHISSCYDLPNHPIARSLQPPFPAKLPTPSYNTIDHALNTGDINDIPETTLRSYPAPRLYPK